MAQVIHVTQVYYAAVIAVVLWDWLLNFSREYRLIWRARWTAGKVAYLLMRYMSTAVAMIGELTFSQSRQPQQTAAELDDGSVYPLPR